MAWVEVKAGGDNPLPRIHYCAEALGTKVYYIAGLSNSSLKSDVFALETSKIPNKF